MGGVGPTPGCGQQAGASASLHLRGISCLRTEVKYSPEKLGSPQDTPAGPPKATTHLCPARSPDPGLRHTAHWSQRPSFTNSLTTGPLPGTHPPTHPLKFSLTTTYPSGPGGIVTSSRKPS